MPSTTIKQGPGRKPTKTCETNLRCGDCQTPLYLNATFQSASPQFAIHKRIPYCNDCMQKFYNRLKNIKLNNYEKIHICCVRFNVGIYKEIVSMVAHSEDAWINYLTIVSERVKKIGGYGAGDRIKWWAEQNKENDSGDESEFDKEDVDNWVMFWGKDYSTDEYMRLDEILDSYLETRPMPDKEAMLKLKRVSRWSLEMEKNMRMGDRESLTNAKTYQDMIETETKSAALRKTDKPLDPTMRIDDLTLALERAGIIRNGAILGKDELLALLAGYHPKYSHTLDLADQMLLYQINATRANQGLPEYAILPDEMRLEDINGECTEAPTEREKEVREKLQLAFFPPKEGGEKLQ